MRDYLDGELQNDFYPFTKEDHLFNCEYFGEFTPLPTGDHVPSSVVSEGEIVGTIAGHPFEATLLCASLTNWYQDSCLDPETGENEAAVIKGSICSEDLYKQLNRSGGRGHHGGRHHDD